MTVRISYASPCLPALSLALLITVLVTAACTLLSTDASLNEQRTLQTTTNGAGNQITAALAHGTLTIDIVSESGIGQGTVTGLATPMPTTITLNLHVNGLEKFQLTSGTTTITAQVSSIDNSIIQHVAHNSTAVQPIDSDDPRWLTILLPDADEPLYIVDVPSQLLE